MARAARWGWTVATLATTGAVLVIAFVLSFSTAEGGFYEREFVWLFWVNVAVALLLLAVIVLVVVRMTRRVRRGKFGSRLLIKLAGIFALVGVLPGLVIYTVSFQFASRSIESWFDVRVARALDAGLALGKGTIDALQSDAAAKAALAAGRLAEQGPSVGALALERVREQLGAQEVSLLGASGQVLVSAGSRAGQIAPDRPGSALLRQARAAGQASQVEGLEDDASAARVRALAVVPRANLSLALGEDRFLFVVQPLPRAVATNALAVQAA